MMEPRHTINGTLNQLHTDGRLLNTVWHFPYGFSNPAVPGDAIKQFEMVNVVIKDADCSLRGAA